MKNTGIKVTEVSVEAMLNDKENSAYNPSIWKESVLRFAKYENIKFYHCPKNELYQYDRFFVSYTIPEGLNFLTEWHAFSSGLTSNGFKRAFVVAGEIFTSTFRFADGSEGVIKNSKEGRQWLKANICSNGTLVTNSI